MNGIRNLSNIGALGVRGKTPDFSPADIDGLALWLDASDTSTIDDSTATPDVDSWTDKSSNALEFVQTASDAKPHTGGSINGLNAISFDGINDFLRYDGTPFSGETGYCFIVVDDTTAVQNCQAVAVSDSSSGIYVMLSSFLDGGADQKARIRVRPVNSGSGIQIRGDTTTNDGSAHAIMTSSNGSAYTLRVDGADESLSIIDPPNDGTWIADCTGLDVVTVGAHILNNSRGGEFEGLIGEIIYYDGVTLTADQIAQVENYLANRWSITLS